MVRIIPFNYIISMPVCQYRVAHVFSDFSRIFPRFFASFSKFSTPFCGKLFGFSSLFLPRKNPKPSNKFLRLPKIKNPCFHLIFSGFPQVFHRVFSPFLTNLSPIFSPFDVFLSISFEPSHKPSFSAPSLSLLPFSPGFQHPPVENSLPPRIVRLGVIYSVLSQHSTEKPPFSILRFIKSLLISSVEKLSTFCFQQPLVDNSILFSKIS